VSDLDRAIRDAAGNANWFGLHAALIAVFDRHKPHPIDGDKPNGPQYCDACLGSDEDYLGYPCPTVRDIADRLGVSAVSSQDTPAPRQARCDRRAGHLESGSGLCLVRCTKTLGCTDQAGHRGRCTTGLWGPLAQGWAESESTRCQGPEVLSGDATGDQR
jgi:hypothetical protein